MVCTWREHAGQCRTGCTWSSCLPWCAHGVCMVFAWCVTVCAWSPVALGVVVGHQVEHVSVRHDQRALLGLALAIDLYAHAEHTLGIRSCATHMPCTCRAVRMPCTSRVRKCRAHAVHVPCVHMPCTCRAVRMPCRAHAVHVPCAQHARAHARALVTAQDQRMVSLAAELDTSALSALASPFSLRWSAMPTVLWRASVRLFT